MTEQTLDPRIRVLWVVGGVLGALLVAVIGGVVSLVAGAPGWVVTLVLVAALLVLVFSLLDAFLAYRAWSYLVGTDGLELRHGVLVRRISLIPYHRIQQIDVRRGPIERSLGLSTLVLRTAAATSDASIPGLSEQVADPLRLDLLGRAGGSDAV